MRSEASTLAPLRATLTQYFGASARLTIEGSRVTVQLDDHYIGGARQALQITRSPSSLPP